MAGGNISLITLALTLVPFAGIAFLWFMGVVRSHLGELEDQFFSTVMFGSALLFLGMIFVSAALAGGIISSYALVGDQLNRNGVIVFGRAIMYTIINVYAIRMAGEFMISLASIWTQTRFMPRPLALLTYALACCADQHQFIDVDGLIFPAWVLIISIFILRASLRNKNPSQTDAVKASAG